MSDTLNSEIVTQVEYYMSDANLKRDAFFQKEMAKDDGFVSVDILLKCNKMKKLTQDAALVMEAMVASEELIISEDKKKVKRKTAPPALDKDVQQRAKRERNVVKGGDVDGGELKKLIEAKAEKACKDRIVYKVTGLPEGVSWADIKDAVNEATKVEGRIFIQHSNGQTEAHVSCIAAKGDAEKLADTADKALTIKDAPVNMTKLEEQAALMVYWVNEFTKNPPKELEKEMHKISKAEKKKEGKKRSAPQSGPVTIAGVLYASKDEVKSKAMELAKRNPDTELEVLEGADRAFAAAILDYHPKATDKKKDVKDYAVGKNPDHPSTRCFFAVKEDGSKVDFSFIKCIDAASEDAKTGGSSSPKAKRAKTEATPASPATRSSPRLKAASPKVEPDATA